MIAKGNRGVSRVKYIEIEHRGSLIRFSLSPVRIKLYVLINLSI